MNNLRLLVFLSILGAFLAIVACGKKAPPFLPERAFMTSVKDLTGEWDEGKIILKGAISPSLESGEAADLIKGARVYHAQYPPEAAPCDDCPIDLDGFDTFDQEVITEGDFLCRMLGKDRGKVYFFRVHLTGAEGTMGPPSNTVKIVAE